VGGAAIFLLMMVKMKVMASSSDLQLNVRSERLWVLTEFSHRFYFKRM
jgi:hypothetical protein